MDWLFEKNSDNAETLITILADESTSDAIYVKEPIRLFIALMWVKFKPRIIVFVFLPYILYLSLLCILTGSLLNSFLINLVEMRFMKEVCRLQEQRAQLDADFGLSSMTASPTCDRKLAKDHHYQHL